MKITDKYKHLSCGDFRDAIFGVIEEIVLSDSSIIILTNDMGAVGLDRITQVAPGRVINVGITEQNMVSVASGLALSGRRVFIYGIISHVIFRALEQIKLDICVQNLPVVIIGVGAGLAYGVDGPTHHGTEDIAVLRAMPNMTIYNPSDCRSARDCVLEAYRTGRPSFVRMDKENVPDLPASDSWNKLGYRVFGELGVGLIISTGIITWAALEAQEILKKKDVICEVIDVLILKPLNLTGLIQRESEINWILVLEEAVSNGGLAETVALAISSTSKRIKHFDTVNLGDQFLLGSAKREWAWKKFGLDGESIASKILKLH